MEVATQNRTGWGRLVCGICPTGSDNSQMLSQQNNVVHVQKRLLFTRV